MHLPSTPTRALLAAGTTLAAVLGWSAHPGGEPRPRVVPAAKPAVVRTVAAQRVSTPCAPVTSTLTVADRSSSRQVVVVRPGGADNASIPVVYLLHGLPGTPAGLTNTGQGLVRAACAAGKRLVVAIPDGTRGRTDTEWADSVDGSIDLETFVTTSVLHAVEGSAPRSSRQRVVAGFSMGGFGAAMIGMRHPYLFHKVVSIAGYFHLDDPDHVFGSNVAYDLAHSPDHLASGRSGQSFLLVDGAQDQEQLVARESQRFATVLRAHHSPVQLYTPPGGHTIRVIDPVLGQLLSFVTS